MASQSESMAEVFQGAEHAHGAYRIQGVENGNGKQGGRADTIREPVTIDLWEDHLAGKTGLGIIPIRSDNTCFWGAIDIDLYKGAINHPVLVAQVQTLGLPLLVCRSKSGGAHLFIFLAEPVQAKLLREKLGEIAAGMGHGACEIFPKQSEVLTERGDCGNWLNIPYFGGDRTTRVGYDDAGNTLGVDDFCALAKAKALTKDQLAGIVVQSDQDVVVDGPPCLEALVAQGFPPQTRNNGLFALGAYFRRAFADDWQKRLEDFNQTRLSPSKSSAEVQAIIKSLSKKDYGYRCREAPLAQFCDRTKCLTRLHGIGAGSAPPVLGALTKQDSDPPVWFLDVDGARIEMQTEDLMSQHRFQLRVLARLNKLPPKYKEIEWQSLVRTMLEAVTIITVPLDASTGGHFLDLLEGFATQRYMARAQEEILLGRPWTDQGWTYFRLQDLMRSLHEQRFFDYSRAQIVARLKDCGGRDLFWRLKGRGVRIWGVPEFDQQTGALPLPEIDTGGI